MKSAIPISADLKYFLPFDESTRQSLLQHVERGYTAKWIAEAWNEDIEAVKELIWETYIEKLQSGIKWCSCTAMAQTLNITRQAVSSRLDYYRLPATLEPEISSTNLPVIASHED